MLKLIVAGLLAVSSYMLIHSDGDAETGNKIPLQRVVVIEGQASVAKARVIAKAKPAAVKIDVAPAPTPKAKAHKRKAKAHKAKAHVCGCQVVAIPYKARNVSGAGHKIKLSYKGFSLDM